MCDEYHDERMRAFWRALADLDEEDELEEELEHPIVVKLAPEPVEPEKRRARPLAR